MSALLLSYLEEPDIYVMDYVDIFETSNAYEIT